MITRRLVDNVLTPNRAFAFAIFAFVFYWVLSLVFNPIFLRDIFNALAFGAALIITVTWFKSAWTAMRNNAATGEWQLILAIFLLWFVVFIQRIYAITFNWYDRPESWQLSAISGFWPYSYMIAAFLFLSAPGVSNSGLKKQTLWSMVLAVGIGCLVAGIMIGASIGTSLY